MKIKVKQLKNIIKEAGGEVSGYYMPNQTNTLEGSIDNLVQNSFPHYVNQLLYDAMEHTEKREPNKKPDYSFEEQIGKATQDLVARLEPIIVNKITSLTKEVLENIKKKKYIDDNKLQIKDGI